MITLIGGEKGGSGKSTIAVNLAAISAGQGIDILLVDTDVRQGASSVWSVRRDDGGIKPRVPCIQKAGKGLSNELVGLAARYEKLIIDVGGYDSMELRYAMAVAHIMVIPVRPTQMDLDTLTRVDSLVERIQVINPILRAFALITMAPTNPNISDVREARAAITEFKHLCLMDSIISERVAYQRCMRIGVAVTEVPAPDKKAAFEIMALLEEVQRYEQDSEASIKTVI